MPATVSDKEQAIAKYAQYIASVYEAPKNGVITKKLVDSKHQQDDGSLFFDNLFSKNRRLTMAQYRSGSGRRHHQSDRPVDTQAHRFSCQG